MQIVENVEKDKPTDKSYTTMRKKYYKPKCRRILIDLEALMTTCSPGVKATVELIETLENEAEYNGLIYDPSKPIDAKAQDGFIIDDFDDL